MINGRSQLSTEVDDLKAKVSVAGVTLTDSSVWNTVDSEVLLLQATDTPPPLPSFGLEEQQSPFVSPSPLPSLADRALARLNSQSHSYLTNQRGSPPLESPNLSEEEGVLVKSPLSPLSPLIFDPCNSGDDISPDLTCTRTHSASSAGDPTPTKDMGDQRIRHRSYSYSSPKISLLPSRFSRDTSAQPATSNLSPDGVFHSVSHSRFRLQALSLSKSLSLLHPSKQREFSLSKQTQEKRELRFRKRAQSADDEGSVELAESLQHLTLSEFLKEIEEEEWDKYNIPSKVESEKYKVIRTFSFLKSRISNTCNKNKVVQSWSIRVVLTLLLHFTVRDSPSSCLIATSASLPMMSQRDRRETASLPNPLSRSVPSATDRLSESPEAVSDSRWGSGQSEDLLQTTESSSSTDSSLGEDCVDTGLHSDLAADALDYEAESWSLTVEHKFCKKQDKRVVKRQDVIYGMREQVQLDAGAVGRVFPCLDELLLLHHDLFNSMRERRHSSAQPYGDRNYVIERIGDVLLQQFSEENAERMKQVYGDFCSHHSEAVTFFKELQQQNKRFQTFIKQQSNNYLVRRRKIPECMLLVTQRITKYPVLLERILQYTQEDSEEHRDLSRALVLIKEAIAAVDLKVSEFEQGQRLQDVLNRMDNRSAAKLKNGHNFRKQDVLVPGRTLKHQGLLLWKTATGRLKDVLALLLTDTLIFLQAKDQKFIFAAVDQKPPVISLQKLIVREVANEERGMFLISASAAGPEMYEVHTSSKDERNSWMRHIREAVESCPEDEEENTSELEEERRTSEARAQKIQKLQESLSSQDHQICSSLEEKLQIYAELSALRGGTQKPHPEPHLLVQPHPEEVPQAAVLVTAALKEAENLRTTLSSRTCSPSSLCSPHRDLLSHPVSPANPSTPLDTSTDGEVSPGDPDTRDGEWSASQALVLQSLTPPHTGDTNNINLKAGLLYKVFFSTIDIVANSVVTRQGLNSGPCELSAAVTIQDSLYEVQKLLLHESDHPAPCLPRPSPPCLQEQEKHRNQEKRREEVAAAVRLQGRLRQERKRWERECQVRHSQQEELESRLEERERQCHLEAERLKREWEELEEKLGEYQQSLERLREGQRSDSLPGQSGVHLDNAGSVFVNEASFTTSKVLNNRHVHHHLQQHQRDDPRAHNSLNTLLACSSQRHTLQPLSLSKTPTRHPGTNTPQGWAGGAGVTGYLCTTSGGQGTEHTPNGKTQFSKVEEEEEEEEEEGMRDAYIFIYINTHSYVRETWSSTATVAGQYQGVPHHGDPQLDLSSLVPLETESGDGEKVGEENIVYL
ncbi:unnamed protein product, partial [Coregonus sp. 'balchen']